MTEPDNSTRDLSHERWLWLGKAFRNATGNRSITGLLSSHSQLVQVDLEIAFRAGAWISVIVLACAAVEASVRQIDAEDYKTKVEDLFGSDPDLQWLRRIRNEIMHSNEPGTPSLIWKVDGHEYGPTHAALEEDAKRAVEIMYRRIYGRKEKASKDTAPS